MGFEISIPYRPVVWQGSPKTRTIPCLFEAEQLLYFNPNFVRNLCPFDLRVFLSV